MLPVLTPLLSPNLPIFHLGGGLRSFRQGAAHQGSQSGLLPWCAGEPCGSPPFCDFGLRRRVRSARVGRDGIDRLDVQGSHPR